VVCAAVAVGWSAHAAGLITWLHLPVPPEILAGPQAGGIINIPAIIVSLAVALSIILLRLRDPKHPRVFSVPFWWLVGPAAIAGCLYLFWNLPGLTQHLFFIWNGIGIAVYALYGVRKNRLAQA
jgi:basic amino acid/polyamine antiporter, APA family